MSCLTEFVDLSNDNTPLEGTKEYKGTENSEDQTLVQDHTNIQCWCLVCSHNI